MDIREDIEHYQDTLSYTSSKVNFSIGENLYMLPSNMNLKIKQELSCIIIKFSYLMLTLVWGKTKNVNLMTPAIKNHKTNSLETPTMKSTQTAVKSERTADLEQKTIISHEDEKVALVLSLTGIFTIWFIF